MLSVERTKNATGLAVISMAFTCEFCKKIVRCQSSIFPTSCSHCGTRVRDLDMLWDRLNGVWLRACYSLSDEKFEKEVTRINMEDMYNDMSGNYSDFNRPNMMDQRFYT